MITGYNAYCLVSYAYVVFVCFSCIAIVLCLLCTHPVSAVNNSCWKTSRDSDESLEIFRIEAFANWWTRTSDTTNRRKSRLLLAVIVFIRLFLLIFSPPLLRLSMKPSVTVSFSFPFWSACTTRPFLRGLVSEHFKRAFQRAALSDTVLRLYRDSFELNIFVQSDTPGHLFPILYFVLHHIGIGMIASANTIYRQLT